MIRFSANRVVRDRAERMALGVGGALLALVLTIPVVSLIATSSWTEFVSGLGHPMVGPALKLSLITTAISLVIVIALGTPLAWTLARSRSRLGTAMETVIELPIVIPPAVAGVALLLTFGRRGLLAGWLYPEGWAITFTTAAVVLAEVFVSAPFFVRTAISAFRRIDENLIIVARTLGASPWRVFLRVALPLASPGILAGALMSWARALGEFGATLMFAGNLPGKTQTLPLAIYTALESDLRAAQALSIVLLIVAFILFALTRRALRSRRTQEVLA